MTDLISFLYLNVLLLSAITMSKVSCEMFNSFIFPYNSILLLLNVPADCQCLDGSCEGARAVGEGGGKRKEMGSSAGNQRVLCLYEFIFRSLMRTER